MSYCLLHDAVNRSVVQIQFLLVGHEELETRHTFSDKWSDLAKISSVEVPNNHMQSVIHTDLWVSLLPPRLVGVKNRLPSGLNSKVDNRGYTTAGRCYSALIEIIA